MSLRKHKPQRGYRLNRPQMKIPREKVAKWCRDIFPYLPGTYSDIFDALNQRRGQPVTMRQVRTMINGCLVYGKIHADATTYPATFKAGPGW